MFQKMHGLVLPFLEEPRDEASRERIALDWLKRVAPHCSAVRSNYDFPAKPRHLADLVHDMGLLYVGGAWLCPDQTANLAQIDILLEETRKGRLDIGLLGNETLFHKYITPRQLIEYLQETQRKMPNAIFTVAERDAELLEYPEVIKACESVVGVHIYPFWDKVHINNAVDHLDKQYHAIKRIAGSDKKVIVLETGWPTEGGRHGNAIASLENSRQYIAEVISWGNITDVEVFFFEAMDESWKEEKVESGGRAGPHFGLWHTDGRPKERTHVAVEAAE